MPKKKHYKTSRRTSIKNRQTLSPNQMDVTCTRNQGIRKLNKKKSMDPRCFEFSREGASALGAHLSISRKPVSFIHQTNGHDSMAFEDIESNIIIGPVAILNQADKQSFGVYAKNDFIKKKGVTYRLGEFLGVKSRVNEHDENVLYSVQIGKNKEINAQSKRSWLAMINGSSCKDTANVEAECVGNKLYYLLKHSVKQGEQFLIYYGDKYVFDNKRFINPNNNWLESAEIYNHNSTYYRINKHKEEFIALPDIQRLDAEHVDLPILACYPNTPRILPQYLQENKTLLHIACEQGDIEQVNVLLSMGANPNQQTSISGISPLHAVVSAPIATETKIVIIESITKQPRASLLLQDSKDESILHLAIKQCDITLIKYVFKLGKTRQKQASGRSIRDCINENGYDYILAAIATGDHRVLLAIKDEVMKPELETMLNYIDEDSDDETTLFFTVLNNRLMNYSSEQIEEFKAIILSFTNDVSLLQRLNDVFCATYHSFDKTKTSSVSSSQNRDKAALPLTSPVESVAQTNTIIQNTMCPTYEATAPTVSSSKEYWNTTPQAIIPTKSVSQRNPLSRDSDYVANPKAFLKKMKGRVESFLKANPSKKIYSREEIKNWFSFFKLVEKEPNPDYSLANQKNRELQCSASWSYEFMHESLWIINQNHKDFLEEMYSSTYPEFIWDYFELVKKVTELRISDQIARIAQMTQMAEIAQRAPMTAPLNHQKQENEMVEDVLHLETSPESAVLLK